MTDEFSARRINVGDVNLNVIDVGAGPAVVLLHGFPDRALMWRHQIHALREAGYRVIAPDLRGYGDSDRPGQVADYTVAHYVADIVGLLDELDVDSFRLAAHDVGATVGWTLASTLPNRVHQYAALSVGHTAANSGAGFEQKQRSWYMLWFTFVGIAEDQLPQNDWQWFRDWAHDGAQRADDEELDRQLRDLERPGALTSALNWYRANILPEQYAQATRGAGLAAVQCPVMGIWSERDMALTERQMTDSARYVAGPWRYERIPHVGHWIPTYAPARTTELLLDFFASAPAPSSA
jgi:pimeloyl-ACP methyl ester carboxylesterase